MQGQIATWTLAATSLAAMVVLLLAIYTWPRGERRRCPGDRGWSRLRRPAGWIRRSDCWQDLHGLPPRLRDGFDARNADVRPRSEGCFGTDDGSGSVWSDSFSA